MKELMKVMIAYDGSVYADAAIDDLRRAGLPRRAEAVIVSVADSLASNAPISEFDLHSLVSRRAEAVLSKANLHRKSIIGKAEESASKAADRLRSQFPEWEIGYQVLHGTPAAVELLRKADEWKPDLIVVGSHGRGAIGRFFLGSVSKKIAEEASCSVRVVRRGLEKDADAPIKIIVGASSLPDVEQVVRAVARRALSGQTKARLIKVDDGVSAGRVSAVYPYANAILESSADELRAAGLEVSVDVKSGNPKSVLLEEAENWEADSIFVAGGASGEADLSRTAAGLITDANYTVEIVR